MTFKSEVLNESIDILSEIINEKMQTKLYFAMEYNPSYEKIGEVYKSLSEVESFIINSPECVGKEYVILEVEYEVEYEVKYKNVSFVKTISVEEE